MAKVKRKVDSAQELPYVPYEQSYACALCDEILPDGARVLGKWRGRKLVGVRVEVMHERVEEPREEPREKVRVEHQCGQKVTDSGEHGPADV